MSGPQQDHGALVPFSFPVSFSFSTSMTDKPKNLVIIKLKAFDLLTLRTLEWNHLVAVSREQCSLSDVQ